MTLTKRIIPKLEIKGENLVKGINLEGLRVIGKPELFAKYYFDNLADELIYQDVVASLYGFNSLENVIKRTAKEIFIPLTVGGGIKNINDISKVLRLGADKVSINSASLKNKKLIKEASNIYGSSTVVISIETQIIDDDYYVFTENGRNNSNIKLLDWISEVQLLGAGEILLTFIEFDGTGNGHDFEIIDKIKNIISVPLIVSGGIGSKEDVLNILSYNYVSGVAISSLLHYDYIKNNDLKNLNFEIGNIDFLMNKKLSKNFDTTNLYDLKKYLINNNIEINL